MAQAPQHTDALLSAVRQLIAADNCNYSRDLTRYEGMFDALRVAYLDASGEDLSRADDAPIWVPAESAPAFRDMLSLLVRTVGDTLRHGLRPSSRAALEDVTRRAAALLREIPGNEDYE